MYKRAENVASHGERRVIGILTRNNVIGGFAGFGGLWLLAGLLNAGHDQAFTRGWFVRITLAVAGAGLGVIATLPCTGISLWDKIVLWISYQIRRGMGQTLLKPPTPARAAVTRMLYDEEAARG